MGLLKNGLLCLYLRLRLGTRVAMDAYIKGRKQIQFGRRCKILGAVALDAGRGGAIVIGNEVTLNRGVSLQGGRGGISLADQVEINSMSMIDGTGGVTIGARTLIGPGVRIISYQHRFERRIPIRQQSSIAAPIQLANDVWIGANAIILAGVSIGEGAVVGAGAVVTKDVPAWAVVVGIPGRVVRYRNLTDEANEPILLEGNEKFVAHPD
jgi:acetyltransferase-like isoleucine patch superfamily enzyme